MLSLLPCSADDYDHGYGHSLNTHYGRGYYGDEHGNFHHSGGSSASASASAGRKLLGTPYYYYGYHNYHDSSAASAAASASGGSASAAAAAASSGNGCPVSILLQASYIYELPKRLIHFAVLVLKLSVSCLSPHCHDQP